MSIIDQRCAPIDRDALVTVTGGSLSSTTDRRCLPPLPRPQPQPQPQPQPRPEILPGHNPKYPPGSLDLPRRNDIA